MGRRDWMCVSDSTVSHRPVKNIRQCCRTCWGNLKSLILYTDITAIMMICWRLWSLSLFISLSLPLSFSLPPSLPLFPFWLLFPLWEGWTGCVVLCHLMIQRDSDQFCPGPLNNFCISSAQILSSEISFNSISWHFISAMMQSLDFTSCHVFPGSSLLCFFCCLCSPLYQ